MLLLSPEVREKYEQFEKSGVTPPAEFMALRGGAGPATGERVLSIQGNEAEISVKGILTKAPDFFASIFGQGNVTYPEIIAALAEADADPAVEKIVLRIDSPGGQFDGLFDTLAAMQSVNKPVRAIVDGRASSAAYAIASVADTITASNKASFVGSIGVVFRTMVSDDEVNIASSDAPKKAPNLKTDEGRAIVREQLDAMHKLFVDTIAEGRGVSVEEVNERFGQGAELLAEDALERGMIDAIAGPAVPKPVSQPAQQEATSLMDISKLKAEHPAVYAAAVEDGVTKERERVVGHLVSGQGTGAIEFAAKAITDGIEHSAITNAEYLTAGINKQSLDDRGEEDADVGAAANGAASDGLDKGDVVMAKVEELMGIEREGATHG